MTQTAFALAAGIVALAAPTAAAAQDWVPGQEIAGHSVQVETSGVTNTIQFEQGGTARIGTPAGNMVPATWTAERNQLCLTAAGATECWTYSRPFEAGQRVTLTSNCNVPSQWLPISTAQPVSMRAGERG